MHRIAPRFGASRDSRRRAREGWVEHIEALADELDSRQTYSATDFGDRFLENYGFNE